MIDLKDLKKFTVSVNGCDLDVYEGLTILKTLLQKGIPVVALCSDPRLERSNDNCALRAVAKPIPLRVTSCCMPATNQSATPKSRVLFDWPGYV